jgi:hypothetical protein
MSPALVEARIGHLQQPADIARPTAHKEKIRFGRIGVTPVGVALQNFHCDERIEEVVRGARV